MKLSVIIIAKNAEDDIADAIESVKGLADEIIVVDNGSTDRTIEVAKYAKAQVLNAEEKDFAQLRNLGFKKAKGDWILYIDTDERVTEDLVSNIKYQVLRKDTEAVAFRVERKNFYLGNHEWPTTEKMERLFKKSALKGWHGELHESPNFEGRIGELDGFLLHYTHKNLTEMLVKTIEWSKIETELRFEAGHPQMTWWRFFRVMLTAFYDSYIHQGGYKVGLAGLIESMYQSFSMFITYARLWEMQQKELRMKN